MRRILPSAIGLLLLGACGDLPTRPADLPEAAVVSLDEAVGCVSDGTCVLEPIVVGPGDCDPAYEDCESDGTCQESTVGSPDTSGTESCPEWGADPGAGEPGGGGTSPGGDEPPPPPCPDWDPDCSSSSQKLIDHDLGACPGCGERAPTSAEKETMAPLINEVTCSDGKATLTQMLNDGLIQVYTEDNGLYGAWNSETQTIYVSRGKHWDVGGAGTVDTVELADTLAHEVVHKLLGHTNGQLGSETHGTAFREKMDSCGFPQP